MADVKPTKNEHIAALEAEVIALRGELAALRAGMEMPHPPNLHPQWWQQPQWGWDPYWKITCGSGSMGPANPLMVTVN